MPRKSLKAWSFSADGGAWMRKTKRRALGFQRFGRGDVGLDHEFFDQSVGVVARAHADRFDAAVGAQFDLVFGQVEIERAAFVARLAQSAVAGFERLQDRFQQRSGLVVRMAVERFLHFVVAEACGRAHQRAFEAVAFHFAAGVERHVAGKHGAILLFLQRTQTRGQMFGQHRHDAIGEIARVAALDRFAVEV